MRWYRWHALSIGQESGNVRTLPFIRFRTERQIIAWVRKRNAEQGTDPLVLYSYERIKGT